MGSDMKICAKMLLFAVLAGGVLSAGRARGEEIHWGKQQKIYWSTPIR